MTAPHPPKRDGVPESTIIVERQPEGEYLVSVPVLPGCYTEGHTLEEPHQMAVDAIQAYCASLAKHGESTRMGSGQQCQQ